MLDEIEPNLCQDGNREGGYHMRALIKVLAAAVALAMSTGAAFAVIGKTTTDVALRTAPAAQAELILNIPEGRTSECRPLLTRLVRGDLLQLWRLRAGECPPIPEHAGRRPSGHPGLSALPLQGGPLSDGRSLLRPATLCRHQPKLLSLALFHDRPRAQPLSLHAARISWL